MRGGDSAGRVRGECGESAGRVRGECVTRSSFWSFCYFFGRLRNFFSCFLFSRWFLLQSRMDPAELAAIAEALEALESSLASQDALLGYHGPGSADLVPEFLTDLARRASAKRTEVEQQ